MMFRINFKPLLGILGILFLGLLILTACNLGRALNVASVPRLNQVEIIVSQTLQADQQLAEQLTRAAPAGPTPLCADLLRCSTPEPPETALSPVTATNTLSPLPPATRPAPAPGAPEPLAFFNQAQWRWQFPEDGAEFAPHEKFTMVWAIQNTGNLPWSPNYRLHFVRGFNTSLFTTTVNLDRWVAPGETIEIGFAAHVPAQAGDYYQAWNLADEQGRDFSTVDFYFSVREKEGN